MGEQREEHSKKKVSFHKMIMEALKHGERTREPTETEKEKKISFAFQIPRLHSRRF
jgi:hypothetical protein